MALHTDLMDVRRQLAKCQEDSARKDVVINQLKLDKQNLEDQIKQLTEPSQLNHADKKSLQSKIKVVLSVEADSGNTYFHDLNFDHISNQNMTDIVKRDLNDLSKDPTTMPKYSDGDIKNACKTYFKSKKRAIRRRTSGTHDKHLKYCRSRERKNKKLEDRKKAASDDRVKLTPEEQERAKEMLSVGLDAVSSEESDLNSDEDDPIDRRKRKPSERVRKVKELFWESTEARDLKAKLDTGYWDDCVKPAQKKKRGTVIKDSTCDISDRQPPKNVPIWMLKTD